MKWISAITLVVYFTTSELLANIPPLTTNISDRWVLKAALIIAQMKCSILLLKIKYFIESFLLDYYMAFSWAHFDVRCRGCWVRRGKKSTKSSLFCAISFVRFIEFRSTEMFIKMMRTDNVKCSRLLVFFRKFDSMNCRLQFAVRLLTRQWSAGDLRRHVLWTCNMPKLRRIWAIKWNESFLRAPWFVCFSAEVRTCPNLWM